MPTDEQIVRVEGHAVHNGSAQKLVRTRRGPRNAQSAIMSTMMMAGGGVLRHGSQTFGLVE